MVDFTKWTPNCAAEDTKDPATSSVACSFEPQALGKLLTVAPGTPTADSKSPARFLWDRFKFTEDDYSSAIADHKSGGGDLTTGEAACASGGNRWV